MQTFEILLVVCFCVGAVQGIIYGIILMTTKSPAQTSNRFLAAILFFFSYRLLVETIKVFGLARYDFWYHILLEYNWVYGALLYFFVLSYTTPRFSFQRKHILHFIPVMLEVTWSFYIKSLNFYWDGTRESLSWLGYYGYIVWMHYPTGYFIASALIVYYSYRSKQTLQNSLNQDTYALIPQKIHWIRNVLWVLIIYSIFSVILFGIDFLFFNFARHLFYGHPVAIGLAMITYWLGVEGFARRQETAYRLKTKLSPSEAKKLEEIAAKLQHKMTAEKLFKDQQLSLNALAKALQVKPYQLTKCLNVIFEKKFNDYINELRIEEVKRLLQDPEQQKYTLLSLAFEAGFNSKASFNRAVKKITGNPPSALKSTQ